MRLRAFVCEVSRQFFAWLGPVGLSDGEVEKRERLVQTYLIVFGLLLSYDRDLALQKNMMTSFVGFLLASLCYYSMLTRSFGGKLYRNLAAFGMALTFSYAVVSCYVAFAGLVGGIVGIMVLFLMIVFLVFFPLLV